jgi:hypothetical protein
MKPYYVVYFQGETEAAKLYFRDKRVGKAFAQSKREEGCMVSTEVTYIRK